MTTSWVATPYSKSEIDRAGRDLLDDSLSVDRKLRALEIVSSWRAAHAYPMHALLMMLRRKSAQVDPESLVVQRTKRASSISRKLLRFRRMRLTQMQDIGGCRAILGTVADVEALRQLLETSRTDHLLRETIDYIQHPKPDGYRCIHLVYEYNGSKVQYLNYLVEIQLRSKIQHAWATAVEIVDTFTAQSMKTGAGEGHWPEFFRLASIVLAKVEGRSVVDVAEHTEAIARLHFLANNQGCLARLHAFTETVSAVEDAIAMHDDYYLIEAMPLEGQTRVRSFSKHQLEEANDELLAIEKQIRLSDDFTAVLVSADSMRSLRKAYPNYFADSQEFVACVQMALRS